MRAKTHTIRVSAEKASHIKPDVIYSVSNLNNLLGLGRSTLYRAIKSKELEADKSTAHGTCMLGYDVLKWLENTGIVSNQLSFLLNENQTVSVNKLSSRQPQPREAASAIGYTIQVKRSALKGIKPNKVYTTGSSATALHISGNTIYRAIKAGDLKAYKAPAGVRIPGIRGSTAPGWQPWVIRGEDIINWVENFVTILEPDDSKKELFMSSGVQPSMGASTLNLCNNQGIRVEEQMPPVRVDTQVPIYPRYSDNSLPRYSDNGLLRSREQNIPTIQTLLDDLRGIMRHLEDLQYRFPGLLSVR